MVFPEGHLSLDLPAADNKPIWLSCPARGAARLVQVLFSRDTQTEVERLLDEAGEQFVFYHPLGNGDGVVIRSWEEPWEQPDIIMPASHGMTADIVLPATYQTGSARPSTLAMYKMAEELVCLELTGFRVAPGEADLCFPKALFFSRTEVVLQGVG
jgi:hypothetical protein